MKIKKFSLSKMIGIALISVLLTTNLLAQGSVSRSGSTWTAKVNNVVIYTGNRMFDAVNTACNNMNAGTIDIWNSGDSGNDNGGSSVYSIRPKANQTLDFHDHTVNCNSSGDLITVVYGDRKSNITVRNLKVTGNPRYAIWFRGCSNITLTDITMNLSNDSPVGLGIRVDASTGSASNLTINGSINIDGSKGHAIETYSVSGVNIGDVTVNNTGGCGILLNDSSNCNVGVVTGNRNNQGGGYATFRVANGNGTTHCEGVYSRNSGRGFFSVSNSRNCTVDWVDIANTTSHCIFLEDATNTHVLCGTVSGGSPNCQIVRGSGNSINVSGCGGSNCNASSTSYIRIRNRATGMYIDGENKTTNGDAAVQYANTSHTNAQWERIDVGSGYYQLKNRTTDMFLDGMGLTSNGDVCGQWANTTHNNSHWAFEAYDGNYYRIRNRSTGMLLDGYGRTANGSDLSMYNNSTSHNAQWELISMSSKTVNTKTDSTEQNAITTPVDTDNELRLITAPNPILINESVTFKLSHIVNNIEVIIKDVTGQTVLTKRVSSSDMLSLVPRMQTGIYFVLVNTDNKSFSQKLIVK